MVSVGIAACFAAGQPALALDVEQVIWGFDGQAVAGRFNPVSIEFSNSTSQPFDGVVSLRRSARGIGATTGAPIVQPVYVGPFERSRWVQFYAYVPNEWETWRIRWPGSEYDLPKPLQREREGPVRVLLFDSDATSRRSGSLRQFPDHLFPPLVTATETLDVIVLGHVPRWQEPRQRAFREWLHRGGTLHLVTDDAGRFPEFPAQLAELNRPAERFQVGRGYVVRHRRSAAQVDAAFVKAAIDPILNPALGQGASRRGTIAGAEPDQAAQELDQRQVIVAEDHEYALNRVGFVDAAFSELKEMTRPDHNWPLIYLLALVYIACIFPGCYLLGLKRIDYRAVYGAILGVVALFSVAFATVGRRGYGEATAINTVAIAHALPDGQWDVTGWSNAFVTSGDKYRITHQGSGVLYSTAQSDETVAGHIVNGPGAELEADIPAFSSRPFVYRTKLSLPDASARVVEWNADGAVQRIVIALDGALAASETTAAADAAGSRRANAAATRTSPAVGSSADAVLGWSPEWPIYAIHGGRFYLLQSEADGRWVLAGDRGYPLATYADTLLSQIPQRHTWFGNFDERIPAEQRYRELQIALVLQALELEKSSELKTYALPPDRLRLFVVAPLPPELHIDNPGLGHQAGQTVYTLDVFRRNGH